MQQNDSMRLVVRRGPQPNQAFEISQDVTTLGRDISNDIVVNDRETSRHHLRVIRSGDAVTIEDLGSTNGTFVNGKRATGITPLQNGDMIGLGETVTLALEVLRPGAAPAAIDPPESAETPMPLMPSAIDDLPQPSPGYTPPPTDYGLQGVPPTPEQPYAPPAGEGYPPAQPAYPAYGEQPAAPPAQPGYYQGVPPGYQAPPAPPQGYPGYDYDPYAVREESGGTSPWLILGCFVFFVLVFVCFAGIALVIIDQLNLWCDLPVIRDIVLALQFAC